MPNVFQYLNYRAFLRDFYVERKAAQPRYSYRTFNRLSGVKSPSLFKSVSEAKRNLSEATVEAFVKGLGLKDREARYFRALVRFNQADTQDRRMKAFAMLKHFREYNEVRLLEGEIFDFYSKWHNLALYELAKLKGFREDPVWIARKLGPEITDGDAAEALGLLKRIGLLTPDPKTRKLKAVNKTLSTPHEVFDLSVMAFHDAMIDKVRRSLVTGNPEDRDVSALTIALDRRGFEEAKRKIQEFRRELNVILSSIESPDRVYQVNFQLFPLTDVA